MTAACPRCGGEGQDSSDLTCLACHGSGNAAPAAPSEQLRVVAEGYARADGITVEKALTILGRAVGSPRGRR